MRHKNKLATAALIAGLLAPALAGAQADPQDAPPILQPPQPAVPVAPASGGIGVQKGGGQLVTLPRPAASIFAADPDVVEVRPASPTSMFVFGKGLGETNIVATDANGDLVARYSVTVNPSRYAADRIEGQSQLVAPDGTVSAEIEPTGTVLHGLVRTPEQAAQAVAQAKLIAPNGTVLNDLQVAEPIQVELKVRIASMNRSTTRQLGIDWASASEAGFNIGKFVVTGGLGTISPTISGTTPGAVGVTFPGGTLEGVVDALASDNLAHVLAEPTLTTVSGTQANFLVGGQFPIPVSESEGQVTVQFKSYGVQLQFTPTVFSDGRIALQVLPQVSAISDANSATLTGTGNSSSSIVVPSLTVQGASSTVILGSGQGMAIAGLLEDTSNQTSNAVPYLGEVPFIGALFRGDSYARAQQELVITVTPYIVNPVDDPAKLALPDDGWTPPNDLQRILLLRDNGTMSSGASIPGDAGFIVQ